MSFSESLRNPIGFKFESPSELEISHHASNPQQQSRYNMISGQVQTPYQPLKNVPTLHNSQYPTGISTPNRGVSRNVGVYQKALDFIPKSKTSCIHNNFQLFRIQWLIVGETH
eukprot:403346183